MLDEPSIGLDPKTLTAFAAELERLNDAGVTNVLVEQNDRFAVAVARRDCFLELGTEGASNIAELNLLLKEVMLRLKKDDVLDLPPKIRSWVPVQIEAAGAWKSYEEFLGWLGNSDPSRPNDTEFLARITKLRVALHKAKYAACVERIKEVLATGQKVVVITFLTLPTLAMFYGVHHWTAAHTGGVVDARYIALLDTALESPLGQIAIIPMLAWIANSAPERLEATFFAVMASFTNLALSAAQLGTQYLNAAFTVTREVKNPRTGLVTMPEDYSDLGILLVTATVISFALPMLAIWLIRVFRLRSA